MAPVQMLKMMMMIESTYGGFEDKKDFKTMKEAKRDFFSPNYFEMGLSLFEIFCKGKIYIFFFLQKNVANSVIAAKTQPSMSCYQVMNLITETNEPHPITPKHTLQSVSSKQAQLCLEWFTNELCSSFQMCPEFL